MGVKKTKIVVVGSFMMDLVIKAERRPRTGETLIGESFGMFVGGIKDVIKLLLHPVLE